jgi:hypothetical protein
MDLITPVSNAIAIFAGMLALGVAVAFISMALASISLNFFKGSSI